MNRARVGGLIQRLVQRSVLGLVLGLVLACLADPEGAQAQRGKEKDAAVCLDEVARDRVVGIDAEGEITVASGRRLRLADVRFAGPEEGLGAERPGALTWLRSLAGEPIEVRAAGPGDRWGRIPARLSVETGGRRVDVAELLVAEGLAWVDGGERDGLCRPDLLAHEGRARTGRRGMWADGPFPLAAAAPDALRAREGRFVVVEGRISSIGERTSRTYLNFGRDFSKDFAVVVPKRQWTALKRARPGVTSLKGRLVRVRGLIEVRRAPQMEIVATDLIEWEEPGPEPKTPDKLPPTDL